MGRLDTTSPVAYAKTVEPCREILATQVIGRFDLEPLQPNVRSRKVYDEPRYTGYEVVMDVFPDVIASGVLLLPKGIKDGEKRPVVVCQHGLEGRPRNVADPNVQNPAYNQFALRLAERGFITFAPRTFTSSRTASAHCSARPTRWARHSSRSSSLSISRSLTGSRPCPRWTRIRSPSLRFLHKHLNWPDPR